MTATLEKQALAASQLLNAQRSENAEAAKRAQAHLHYYQRQAQVNAAIQREADRIHAIGSAGRYDESQAGAHFYSH
jgi:hypothetical protein